MVTLLGGGTRMIVCIIRMYTMMYYKVHTFTSLLCCRVQSCCEDEPECLEGFHCEEGVCDSDELCGAVGQDCCYGNVCDTGLQCL